MDDSTLITIIWGIIGAVGSTGLVLIGWGIKVAITTLVENTVQIKILNSNFEKFAHIPAKVEKHDQDIRAAHDKIREIRSNG